MTAHEIRDEIGADRPVDARHTATPGRPASSLGWAAVAAGGLGAFALLTWIVASRLTLGFDQPLLDAAHGFSQYQALWQGLSDVANLPLIAIGIGLVLTLLVR